MYTELKILLHIWFLNHFPQTHSTGTDDTLDNVSETRKVSHYDCREMQENRMYSINNVAPCKISPENIAVLAANVLVYQRSYKNGSYNYNV